MAVQTPTLPATGVAVANQSGQYAIATFTGGTVQTVVSTIPNLPTVATPAVPASTVTATNNTGYPVLVALTGGTTTVISVNGTTVATTTPANVVVPNGGTIAVTYSVAPSWTWTAVFAGLSGNPLASPASVPVPPGGSVTPYYTAAPAWAWTDPVEEGYTPLYSQENVLAEGPGYSQAGELPMAQHAVGGLAGLGTGVTN
jgi:hypothetical protein